MEQNMETTITSYIGTTIRIANQRQGKGPGTMDDLQKAGK